MNPKAIIFNTSYNGLSIIQELSLQGVKCIAMDCKLSVGRFTKYAQFKKCPNPIINETGFIDFLYDICQKEELKPILIPTNDEWALITAKYKNKLSEVSIPCVSSYETVSTLLEKDTFYKIGKEKGYMTPLTWDFEDLNNLDLNNFPIIAKPKYKTVPNENNLNINKQLRAKRLVILESREELKKFVGDNQTLLPHLVFQEYIRGNSSTMFTVGIYANSNSEVKAVFTGRKVRGYPADIGDNILGEAHDVPANLISNMENIVKDFKYTGIAEFEYKLDEETNEYKLIEINPRAWSWIGITPYCGVNIPFIAYQSLIGNEEGVQFNKVSTGSVKYVKIYQDFVNCMIRYKFNYKPWHMSYRNWRKSLEADTLIKAETHRKDLLVSLFSLVYLFGKLIKQKWRA
jgi:D-aspartate ligase